MNFGYYASVIGVVLLGGCSRSSATADPVPAPAPPAPPPAPKVETPLEKILHADSYAGALSIAKPAMNDATNKTDPGALLLLAWAIPNMRWTDIGVATDETTFALARKDSDEARGKRLCATGSLIQIEKEKTDIGKFFSGLLMSYAGNIFTFLAVGSTGTLVQNNSARFCGVVTGLYDYSNSGGGVGHAVQLVGMFDLPENKVVARSATSTLGASDKPTVAGGGATPAKAPSDSPAPASPCSATCAGAATADLQTALAFRAKQSHGCYDAAVASDSSLKGNVVIGVRIGSNGQVCSASVASNDMGSPAVAQCIANKFRQTGLFPAPKGGCVDATVPLTFP